MEDKKVLLSIKDLQVKFRVRGRMLTAIRDVSLDIYENESIAIVGESGSGKSVFTKTFAGMLDSNGFISNGNIIFNDKELSDTSVKRTKDAEKLIEEAVQKLNESSKLELGAAIYQEIQELKLEKEKRESMSEKERAAFQKELAQLKTEKNKAYNLKQTLDSKKEKTQIAELTKKIKELDHAIKNKEAEEENIAKSRKDAVSKDTAYMSEYNSKLEKLNEKYKQKITGEVNKEAKERNSILAKEIYLSVGRFSSRKRKKLYKELLSALEDAMRNGVNLYDEDERNRVFDSVAFRVKYLNETEDRLNGTCVLNLAKIKDEKDWVQIRGRKIATVFQDPMTSLNPIITIGKQISSIIMKHQKCSEVEARVKALEMMEKVGIPNAEERFDDYPFQYSGGMRQRIVIAIALSCQPKILICDEPTTALDVTIQAQILKLIKDLQKEFHYTIVFITHDLGVVANVADRVAVLYAGQIVEVGSVEDIFYDPRHPYTWALLSSLPQLAQKNTKLYSITGTPPSLYNTIVGDPFAPRNPYCMKIDTLKEPPMFRVSEGHYAKTWLLDPRSKKVEKPEMIQNIHEKLINAFNI